MGRRGGKGKTWEGREMRKEGKEKNIFFIVFLGMKGIRKEISKNQGKRKAGRREGNEREMRGIL